MTYSDG